MAQEYRHRAPTGPTSQTAGTVPFDDEQGDEHAAADIARHMSHQGTAAGSWLEAPQNRYRILSSLHQGGMGEILLAEVEGPAGFSRKVVLKGLLTQMPDDSVGYQMFVREARLMAQLDHPNVVRVFDFVMIDECPYLVMEYLRGRNLHQVIQRAVACIDDMPLRIALHVVAEASRGLHYAHTLRGADGQALRIVHRDVTPGNLLVSFFGEVRITDFGIAKTFDAPKCTSPKTIRGKARYIAPEQVYGESASVASDIYSAGVVLAEAIVGGALWERETVPETLLAIVSEDRQQTIERILRDREEVPGLASALRGALALSPADRFASALQFAEVLEAIARSLGGPCTHSEVSRFLRTLYHDAPDLPPWEGIQLASAERPQDESPYDNDDPTIIEVDRSLLHRPPARLVAVPKTSVPAAEEADIDVARSGTDAQQPTILAKASIPLPESTQPSKVPIRVPEGVRRGSTPRALRRMFKHVSPRRFSALMAGVLIGATIATVGCIVALKLS